MAIKTILAIAASHVAHSLWEFYLARTKRFIAGSTIELISGAGSRILGVIRKLKK